jgi:hypothetical protein
MKKVAFALALTMVLAGTSHAQNTGTVTVNGTVGNAASLRWWSYTPLNTESGVNAPAPQNSPLLFTLDLGDVAAGNNLNAFAGGTVQLMLRSNNTYTLSAQVTSAAGFGVAANGDVVQADIGFGLANLANSGPLVLGDPATNSTIVGAFANDPSGAALDVDGVPTFSATLADLAGPQPVLSGPRISAGGGMGSPNNGLLVDTIYALAPQLFTPTGAFSATVTYTMSTP